MTNARIPNDDNANYVTLERVTLSSMVNEPNQASTDLVQISSLLKDESLSAEEVLEKVAERLESAGRYEEALALLPQDLLRRDDPLPPRVLALLWFRFASLNRWTGNTPRAIWCATNCLHVATDIGDTILNGAAHALLGYCYWMIDEYAIAYDHLVAARKRQEEVGDVRPLAQTLWNLSIINHLEGRLEDARENCQRGLELLGSQVPLTLADHLTLGKLQNTLALLDTDEGYSREAVAHCQQAITHWSESKDNGLMSLGHTNLAAAQLAIGDWAAAENSLDQAKELIANLNPLTECQIHITYGLLYVRQGKLAGAEKHARRATEIAMETGQKSSEAAGWELLGQILLAHNRVEDALLQFQHSLLIYTKIGRRIALPEIHLRIAEVYVVRKEPDLANQHLQTALDLLHAVQKHHLTAWATRLKGSLHLLRQEMTEGVACLAQSISLFESISYVYEAACSECELGAALNQSDPLQAQVHLESALETFRNLGAEPKRLRAVELLLAIKNRRQVVMRPGRPFSLDDVVVMERLTTAATSHEMLLREVAALLFRYLHVEVMVVEETGTHGFKAVAAQGLSDRQGDKLLLVLREHLEGSRPLPKNVQIRALTDASLPTDTDLQRHFWMILRVEDQRPLPDPDHLNPLLRFVNSGLELCRLRTLVRTMRKTVNVFTAGHHINIAGVMCESPAMRQVIQQIQKIRSSDATVLITGESGVGKELIARAIHTTSARQDKPFLPFNCASIPSELVESRLFGHTKGSFTGADKDAMGVIRAASGGTLFLDEIGELELSVQPKLLRFLQEREIHALGDNLPIKVDVRVLAATNRDLEKDAERGTFREDLYHRLNVIRIEVPPLRERPEDIPLIARYVLAECAKKENKDVAFSEAALDALCSYNWPGNVRQLKNEIERAVIMAEPEAVLVPEDFSTELRHRPSISGSFRLRAGSESTKAQTLAAAIEEVEKRVITDALRRHNGNISRVARELDISRNGLALKCKRLGIDTNE
ncbi:MAG: sigma 54-interacting transcriptional regulator [Blastocatellia bacterium]|nr:sigma 54-interacting transcriptional regulator [Blastocatellia bacterium]